MKRPYIPEYRKANMTGDFREIALSLCTKVSVPYDLFIQYDPKYVPFGRTYVNGQEYTLDGRLLGDFSIERYIYEFAAEHNLNANKFIEDIPGFPREYNLPCRCWTVKDFLETEIDNYDIIPSYEQAFKDIFNLEYKEDEEITTHNIEKYIHVMRCVDPDNSNITFNVASTAELINLVRTYAERLEDNNRISSYFDEY